MNVFKRIYEYILFRKRLASNPSLKHLDSILKGNIKPYPPEPEPPPALENSDTEKWAKSFGVDFKSAWNACPNPEWLIYLAAGQKVSVKKLINGVWECLEFAWHNPLLEEYPESGEMFGFVMAGNKSILDFADKSINDESSDGNKSTAVKCYKAAMAARDEASSIVPGACRFEQEAREAATCRSLLEALESFMVGVSACKSFPKAAFSFKGKVKDVFGFYSGEMTSDVEDAPEALICVTLANAVNSLAEVSFGYNKDSDHAVNKFREIIEKHI